MSKDKNPDKKPDEKKKTNLPATLQPSNWWKRLISMSERKVSLAEMGNSVVKGSVEAGKLMTVTPWKKLVKALELPGGPDTNQDTRRATLKALQSGVKGITRKDGSLLISSYGENVLRAATRQKVDLTDAWLVKRKITSITFTDNVLTKADIRGARLSGVRASGTKFNQADFRSAKFDRTHFNGCDFTGADFTKASFEEDAYSYNKTISFTDCNLDGAKFSLNADFRNIRFKGCDLSKVIIIDREGKPIPGAKLTAAGTVMIHAIPDAPAADAPTEKPFEAPGKTEGPATPPKADRRRARIIQAPSTMLRRRRRMAMPRP
ncbi:MAG: hypothetical protein Alpg2KO_26860 [Alphaproteobacteria bacterium]